MCSIRKIAIGSRRYWIGMKELGASKFLHEGRTTRCTNMTTALTDMSIQFEVLAVNVEVEALRNIHKLQVHSSPPL